MQPTQNTSVCYDKLSSRLPYCTCRYEQEQRLGEMQETEADVHLKEVRDLPDDIGQYPIS